MRIQGARVEPKNGRYLRLSSGDNIEATFLRPDDPIGPNLLEEVAERAADLRSWAVGARSASRAFADT